MSGGHFDYSQYQIGQIAEEIDHLVRTNNSTELDDFGQEKGYNYPPEIIERFKIASITLRMAEAMAQRVDWLVSGDDGEETFMERWDNELNKISKEGVQS